VTEPINFDKFIISTHANRQTNAPRKEYSMYRAVTAVSRFPTGDPLSWLLVLDTSPSTFPDSRSVNES
jgi:hypothetical protein